VEPAVRKSDPGPVDALTRAIFATSDASDGVEKGSTTPAAQRDFRAAFESFAPREWRGAEEAADD
jgi:hypothetical protein